MARAKPSRWRSPSDSPAASIGVESPCGSACTAPAMPAVSSARSIIASVTSLSPSVSWSRTVPGIGENASAVREGICKQLSYLGIQLDTEKNDATHGVQEMISADDSSVPVYVIPTNEELMIARDTRAVVTAAQA